MRYIAYYRVSTRKQGKSGIGLESQKQCVLNTVKNRGGEIIKSFKEVQSGRKINRIELVKAIAECKELGATLIIAKLDRLSRNAAFTLHLLNSGVKFFACDMPDANETTIGIYAVLAEQEAKRIRERTIESYKIRRKQGKTFGNDSFKKSNKLQKKGGKKSGALRSVKAKLANKKVLGTIKDQVNLAIARNNKVNWSKIAIELNDRGYKTTKGNEYSYKQVKRLYEREACTV